MSYVNLNVEHLGVIKLEGMKSEKTREKRESEER
jgi:hypothetical protein